MLCAGIFFVLGLWPFFPLSDGSFGSVHSASPPRSNTVESEFSTTRFLTAVMTGVCTFLFSPDLVQAQSFVCPQAISCCNDPVTFTVDDLGNGYTAISVTLCSADKSRTVPSSSSNQECSTLNCCSEGRQICICGQPTGGGGTWGTISSCSHVTVSCTNGSCS